MHDTLLRLTAIVSLTGTFAFAFALQGCATPGSSADVYSSYQAQRGQSVQMGTVESVRAVIIQNDMEEPSGLGALGGGALGAVGGSAFGGGRGALLTTIAGGIAGAVAGNRIEHGVGQKKGVEITVKLDHSRRLVAITQAATNEIFRAGDRIRVLSGFDGVQRITH